MKEEWAMCVSTQIFPFCMRVFVEDTECALCPQRSVLTPPLAPRPETLFWNATDHLTSEMLLHFSVLLLILAQKGFGRTTNNGPYVSGRDDQVERRQICKWPCKCPPRAQCAPGVSSVLDGCGCCKSCARQIGDRCNERDVCDPHKGMYCDFSRDKPKYEVGLCSYMMAVGCDLNGVHYENGEAFQTSPLYKCTCIGGAIGCTPVFIQKPTAVLSPASLMARVPAGLQKLPTSKKHQQDTTYMSAYRDPPLVWKKNCLVQSTPWSPCSKSCGLGISVRINNNNSKCEMRKERRLCLLRPCDKTFLKSVKVPKGKTCRPKSQAKKAEKLTMSGCTSTRKLRPMYCGVCTDKRCCVPNKSRMIPVTFLCKDGSSTRWKMQWIISCVCQKKCSDPGDMFSELLLL